MVRRKTLAEKQPIELMTELYELMHKEPMSEDAVRFVQETMKKVGGMQA